MTPAGQPWVPSSSPVPEEPDDFEGTDVFGEVVESYLVTCRYVPTQFEGTLKDGTVFYLRYRYSQVSLGFGSSLDEAVADPDRVVLQFGLSKYDGIANEAEMRCLFGVLFTMHPNVELDRDTREWSVS